MADAIQELEQALEDFDARNSPLGKLKRYRDERLSRFYGRLALVMTGVVAVGILISLEVAVGALGIYLIGEAIDSAILLRIPKWLDRGMPVLTARRWTFVGSLVQTSALCIFIFIAWFFVPRESAIILCLSLLGGSGVNALTAMPLNRKIGIMRLSLFAGLIVSLAIVDTFRFDTFPVYLFFNLFGAAMLIYLIIPFVTHATRERGKENSAQRRLLAQGLALAKANSSLYAKQQETRRLALVAQRASDAICLVDPKGKVVWANEGFVQLTGYELKEILGHESSDFFNSPGEENEASQVIKDGLRDGASGKIVNMFHDRGGEERWLETSFGPVFDEEGQLELMFIIDRDITDIKTREIELEEARIAAEKGEHAKSSFLATMSHEIRTPMNGIIGMSELLSKSDLSKSDRLYVDTIHSSGEALLTIINDILDFSKLNDGHLTIKPTTFALKPCLNEVMNLLRPQAKAKGLDLWMDCTPELPSMVIGDDGRLRQILINVIGNAIKFTDNGHVGLKVSATMKSGVAKLVFNIEDSGIGIPEDQLDRIFERFAQADAASTRRFGGTGLGLPISRSLARLMNGDITAENLPNKGARFRFTADFGIAKQVASEEKTVEKLDGTLLVGAKVLLAEDNRTNRLVIEKFLQGTQVDLSMAVNGQEAVDAAIQSMPDIILMDMSMPIMDGLEATRRIRDLGGVQPVIIALTANAYASDKEACLQAGMDSFLSKPVRRGQLIHELTRAKAHAGAHLKAS
ncbi:PAS/PAC sensor hybrid histidine kinase [Shimia isoporae]|uniref:histidine kinase n=1 Tax=Shimia isoporae TaxID=647720 RepID=A0A4R1N3T5_9RHOB|nr:PAS domain-containing hybrid sensor histidine kinase/response regulator [Shimia isoporae]TCL01397.1 PAS/PAC sensor hybrid histidine kinase [Shimia isoporae]